MRKSARCIMLSGWSFLNTDDQGAGVVVGVGAGDGDGVAGGIGTVFDSRFAESLISFLMNSAASSGFSDLTLMVRICCLPLIPIADRSCVELRSMP